MPWFLCKVSISVTKIDPIIAVKNVELSSQWYQTLLSCRSKHGGSTFDILVDENDEVLLCLHKWGEHDHPTMIDSDLTPGNGLILYLRTNHLTEIYKNAINHQLTISREIQVNPNSRRKEFSLRDPDGYYLTITELHNYEG